MRHTHPSSDHHDPPSGRFAHEVLTGLSSTPKSIPSKYLYDSEGSRLFSLLTETPDYYPTRCEFEVIERHGPAIARAVGGKEPFRLIELGAGDGRKTSTLIQHLREANLKFEYQPVDISETALQDLYASLRPRHPDVPFAGIVGDYLPAIEEVMKNDRRRSFVLFLGSNIGNFSRDDMLVFLGRIRRALRIGDHMMIGFDLKKSISTLLKAYNDSEGITRRFNLNLLTRMNRELGARFRLNRFDHYGTYNPRIGAMESFLISIENQVVPIEALGREFEFDAFEPIHVEYSYKFLPTETRAFAAAAGFDVVGEFQDERNQFLDSLWQVQKNQSE